jgi:hypothetical protein
MRLDEPYRSALCALLDEHVAAGKPLPSDEDMALLLAHPERLI